MIPHFARQALSSIGRLRSLVLSAGGRTRSVIMNEQVARVIIIQEKISPSLDYLVLPAVRKLGVPIEQRFLNQSPNADEFIEGTLIILVRYLNDQWRSALERNRSKLAGIVYFMDDDLLYSRAYAGLPAPYQRKLFHLVARHRDWFVKECSEFWVSTAALAQRYADLSPVLVPWEPSSELLAQSEPIKICYHGSSSHTDEQVWLKQVMPLVLEACPSAHFEIFGDLSINRLFRVLPRTTILHPLSWENYLAFAAGSRRDIGLAPLLPSRFNSARGPTKFYDFARLGAAGVYSDVPPYKGFVNPGIDGLLLENSVAVWVDSIIDLVTNTALRNKMSDCARQRATTHCSNMST